MSDIGVILQMVAQDQPALQGKQDGDLAFSSTAPQAKKGAQQHRDAHGQIGETTRAKPLTKHQKKQTLYVVHTHNPCAGLTLYLCTPIEN